MQVPTVQPDPARHPFAPTALHRAQDWVDGRAEALDMALSARAARVSDTDVAAAFGAESVRLARVAAALGGQSPTLPPAPAAFVATLEARLGHAFADRALASQTFVGQGRASNQRASLIARLPGFSELALAAAVTLALGTSLVRDGWRPAPALAATPTTSVHRTRTPLGPTGTATGGTPAATVTAP